MNLERDGDRIVNRIKRRRWFPYHTGNLKFNATSGGMLNNDTYLIKLDGVVAPYVQCLEEGTGPHDIPRAFGVPLPFGIGGRFSGKFHPGSKKHKGFIEYRIMQDIFNYYREHYDAEVLWGTWN